MTGLAQHHEFEMPPEAVDAFVDQVESIPAGEDLPMIRVERIDKWSEPARVAVFFEDPQVVVLAGLRQWLKGWQ